MTSPLFTSQVQKNKVADALSLASLGEEHVHEADNVVAVIDADSSWGTLIIRNELRASRENEELCRNISERLSSSHRRGNKNADMGFGSHLLAEDGLLLRYIPQIDDQEGGSTDILFRDVIPG